MHCSIKLVSRQKLTTKWQKNEKDKQTNRPTDKQQFTKHNTQHNKLNPNELQWSPLFQTSFNCCVFRVSGCGNFSLHWRPVGDLLLLFFLWSVCCLFDRFPISILNFIRKPYDFSQTLGLLNNKFNICDDFWGSCCLFFSFLCCVMHTIFCLFVFFIFSHAVVSLFSIYEFECPSGNFRPSFIDKNLQMLKWFCQRFYIQYNYIDLQISQHCKHRWMTQLFPLNYDYN